MIDLLNTYSWFRLQYQNDGQSVQEPMLSARMVHLHHVSENSPKIMQSSSDMGVKVNARNLIYSAIAWRGMPELPKAKNTLNNN